MSFVNVGYILTKYPGYMRVIISESSLARQQLLDEKSKKSYRSVLRKAHAFGAEAQTSGRVSRGNRRRYRVRGQISKHDKR